MIFFEVWDSAWGEYGVWRVLGSLLRCGKGRVAISCLCLRFVLIFKGNVLENMNVLISKKRAYF